MREARAHDLNEWSLAENLMRATGSERLLGLSARQAMGGDLRRSGASCAPGGHYPQADYASAGTTVGRRLAAPRAGRVWELTNGWFSACAQVSKIPVFRELNSSCSVGPWSTSRPCQTTRTSSSKVKAVSRVASKAAKADARISRVAKAAVPTSRTNRTKIRSKLTRAASRTRKSAKRSVVRFSLCNPDHDQARSERSGRAFIVE
jgi:hypothetical protein